MDELNTPLLNQQVKNQLKRGKPISAILFENTTGFEIPIKQKLENLINWMIQTEKQPPDWEISIIYINNETISQLNKKHLNKNRATDVISFNLTDEFSENPEGEIYISLEQAQQQAIDYSASFEEEVIRLTAHGVFHLFGYEDETEEKRNHMSQLENSAIEYFQNHKF